MSPRSLKRLVAIAGLLSLATACSLIIGGFKECDETTPCANGLVCSATNFCVGEFVPEGCRGLVFADGGIPATFGGGEIKVGVLAALTNPDGTPNDRSIQNWNAIKLALEEVNPVNYLNNRGISLVTCDFAGDTNRVNAQVEWMATVRKTPAIIVYRSAAVLQVRQLAVDHNVLIVSPSATAKEISVLSDKPTGGTVGLIWRTAPSDELQARVMAEILKGNSAGADAGFANVRKLGILYQDDNYGRGLSQIVRDKLQGDGGRTVSSFQFTSTADIDDRIRNGLNAFDPDVTVVIAQAQVVSEALAIAATQPNLKRSAGHQWFFTDSAKQTSLLSGGNLAEIEGAVGTAPAPNAGSGFGQFKDRFTSRFGVDPVDYPFTSHSYDAMYLIYLGAIHAAGPNGAGPLTGEGIAEGLTRLSSGDHFDFKAIDIVDAANQLRMGRTINVSGASGELDFDPVTGDAPSAFEVWRVRRSADGGYFEAMGNVDPPPN